MTKSLHQSNMHIRSLINEIEMKACLYYIDIYVMSSVITLLLFFLTCRDIPFNYHAIKNIHFVFRLNHSHILWNYILLKHSKDF